MRAPYNRPGATPNPPHGKTKSRSLTAVRQQRATGFGMTDITRQSLIGNGMHSPASATALQCATSVFLSGNEFHSWRVSQKSPTLTNRAWGTRKKQVSACPPRWARASGAGGMTGKNTQAEACATQSGVEPQNTKKRTRLGSRPPRRAGDGRSKQPPRESSKADSSHGQSAAGFGMTSRKQSGEARFFGQEAPSE